MFNYWSITLSIVRGSLIFCKNSNVWHPSRLYLLGCSCCLPMVQFIIYIIIWRPYNFLQSRLAVITENSKQTHSNNFDCKAGDTIVRIKDLVVWFDFKFSLNDHIGQTVWTASECLGSFSKIWGIHNIDKIQIIFTS